MRRSDGEVPTFDPGVRCCGTGKLSLNARFGDTISGNRHMGMTISAQTPSKAVRRRIPAKEVEKHLK